MEGRVSRGRGGGWKRGGRGGHVSDTSAGEHRGRGRGGHHRGRGKRDHRGRGRGGGGHVAEPHYRDQDERESGDEGDDRTEGFSRRKLESNWDRYEESERREPDDDTPAQRGTDFHVLLESAGDSFTQFRFLEEKGWEMDSFTGSQMSAVFVDLQALAQSLQQVPLHQRLNLEAELVQVLTPVALPPLSAAPKQEMTKTSTFKLTPASSTNQTASVSANPASGSKSQVSPKAAEPPVDDGDDELDQLLSLQKPAVSGLGVQSAAGPDEESAVATQACEETRDEAAEAQEEKMEEVKEKEVKPPNSASMKQEMTEEDLEDWLDSMIS